MIPAPKQDKMLPFWVTCLLICSTIQCLAQKDRTGFEQNGYLNDNFRVLTFSNLNVDTTEIKALLKSADVLQNSNPDSSRDLANEALNQSKRINYQYGIAYAVNMLGLGLQNQGLYDSAIRLFKQSKPSFQAPRNRDQLFRLYINVGNGYFFKGKYGQALENYYEALESIGKHNKVVLPGDSVMIYANIGLLWGRLGEQKQALNSLTRAKQIAQQAKDSIALTQAYSFTASVYYSLNQEEDAIPYYKQALQIAERYELIRNQIPALNGLSSIYIRLKKPEIAMDYIQKALQILALYPDAYNYDRLHTQHNLGQLYLERKEYAKARQILTETLEKAQSIDLKDIIGHVETDVAEVYAATGNYQKAYEHILHYALFKDTLFQQEKSKSLDIWMHSRMSKKDKELMAQQLHITKQKSQLQAKNFWITGTVLGALLLLAVSVAFIRSYRHKQRLQQSDILQLRQEQEINQLKAQVRGEEQERNRIALELHDGIASQLWAIKLNVDSLQQQQQLSGEQQQRLLSIYQQLDDTTHDVRKTAHNLMPDLLLEEGLATALASLCEQIGKNTNLEVDFLEYGTIPRMDEEIELSLYRMIQELIQNVLKHAADASQLLVQLSCINTLLNITVEDNGAGFLVNEEGNGVGLHHIQKRVKAMRGHMDLKSTKGKGTTVYLEFDIQHLL